MIDSEFEKRGRIMSDLGYHNYFAAKELAAYGKWLDTLPDDVKETINDQAQRIAELEAQLAAAERALEQIRTINDSNGVIMPGSARDAIQNVTEQYFAQGK